MARRTATNGRQVPETRDLAELSKAAASCKACDLGKRGTQTVFGEGKRSARVMMVGEQPGKFAESVLRGEPNRSKIVATQIADRVRELV